MTRASGGPGQFAIALALCLVADAAFLLLWSSRVELLAETPQIRRPAPPPPRLPAPQQPDRLQPIVLEWAADGTRMSLLPQFRARLRLDEASAPALAAIPGLGRRAAEGIIEHRRRLGPFRHRAELLDVPGIGWTTYLKVLDFVSLDGVRAVGADEPEL